MHRLGAVAVVLLVLCAGCQRTASQSQSQGLTEWQGDTTVPLLADKSTKAGSVRAWFEGGRLNVQVSADAPWSLAETQLDVQDDWSQLPQTKTHNPIPGHFAYQQSQAAGTQSYTFQIDPSALHGPRLALALHADLVGPGGSAGAWAAGTRFTERGNWATWFALDTQVESVSAEGDSWQLLNDRGILPDGTPYEQSLFLLQNEAGVTGAPLPSEIADDLGSYLNADDTFLVVNQSIVDEIVASEKAGQLTPALAAIAEEQETVGKLSKKCPAVKVTHSTSIDVTTPYEKDFSLGEDYSGTISASGDLALHGGTEVQMWKVRFKLLFWCIPYAALFDHLHAWGSASVGQGGAISGSVTRTWSWEKEVKDIQLKPLDFFVGPIWVHVPLHVPIVAGLDIETALSGTAAYASQQRATGSFDYMCTPGCRGTSSYSVPSLPLPDVLNGSVSAQLKPDLWVDAALNASLYWNRFLNAQVGVRPKLRGDLWGYYGNACGDADGDGQPEVVSALTADLDFQVFVTWQWQAFNGTPHKNDDVWHTQRWHLLFKDLIGSSAMSPMLAGPANAQIGASTDYQVKMRPCWPYGDAVAYQLDWGDGATQDLQGAPGDWTAAAHAWANAGTERLELRALRDSHGRTLDRSTARSVEVQLAPVVPVPSTGLKLWLRADEGVEETSGQISRWVDQSGNGNDAFMPTAARRPVLAPGELNGKPVVRFDGAQSLFLTDLLQLPQATVFVVARNGRLDDQFNMILGPAGNADNLQLRFENGTDVLLVTPDVFTANIGDNRTYLALAVRYDGATWSVFRDGNIRSSYDAASGTWSLNQVGAWYSTYFMTGEIAEVMAYDRPLTESERAAVNAYLRTKYNLP